MEALSNLKREYKCGMVHWKDQKALWKTRGNVQLGSEPLPRYLCNSCKDKIEVKNHLSLLGRILLIV